MIVAITQMIMKAFRKCLIQKIREQAHQRTPIWSPQLQCIQLLLLSLKIQHDLVPGSLLFQDARHFLPPVPACAQSSLDLRYPNCCRLAASTPMTVILWRKDTNPHCVRCQTHAGTQ